MENDCKIKKWQSSGIDDIINEFIKHSQLKMTTLLVQYFNLILDTGIVLNDCKFCMLLINTRLKQFLNDNTLLREDQAWFKSQYSTLDHICTLHCVIDLYTSKKIETLLCLY